MRELSRLLGGATVYVAGAGPGYKDDILIDADKNPNTKGVTELAPGAKTYSQLLDDLRSSRVSHVIALGGVTPRNDPEDATALGMLGTLVVIASHEGALTDAAHVVLPATSWAEHNGTYVNRQGIHQLSEKGPLPQGDSKPAWELARLLGVALGLEVSWSKLKDVRSLLVGTAASSRDVAAVAASPTGAP